MSAGKNVCVCLCVSSERSEWVAKFQDLRDVPKVPLESSKIYVDQAGPRTSFALTIMTTALL